jgi:hypothetical protein
MSKLETPLTLRFWESVGGTLVLEFPVVRSAPGVARRLLDGLILPDAGEYRVTHASEVDLTDQNVVIVQTKANRLGMYLMGQAFFSAQLLSDYEQKPATIRTVAVCTGHDERLEALCARNGIEVVVYEADRGEGSLVDEQTGPSN